MAQAKFEKLAGTDALLYGPPKLLLCGFSQAAQSKFKSLLASAGLDSLPLVWATQAELDLPLSHILQLPEETGVGGSPDLARAVIVSGIKEKQLHLLMTLCRKTRMQPALWAVLTPSSEKWTLRALLSELQAEREAMRRRK